MPAEATPAEEIKSVATIDEDAGTITQTVGPSKGFEIKSEAGSQRSYVEGYVATKGIDSKDEIFAEEALKSIAEQINNSNKKLQKADVVFPDPEDIETLSGNLEHQSSPALEKKIPWLADVRTVPAFELADAEYDGFGTKVRAYIRENALPEDVVEAIKNNIRNGYLNAFSVEFKALKDAYKQVEGEVRRVIQEVKATGAAATTKPIQENATFTDFELKSALADSETILGEGVKEEVKAELFEELKAEMKQVAGVSFRGTKDGDLDESEIPSEGFEPHYLFAADTKTDSKFPVVDADGYLRKGNVDSAYQLRANADNVSEEEVINKLEKLNDEFDTKPIDFDEEEGKSDAVNNINGDTTVPEEKEETQEEVKSDAGDGEGDGDVPLKDEVEELKSMVEGVKETNEELKSEKSDLEEENEELKSKIEDFEEIEEMKSEVENGLSELKEELKSAQPEDAPVADDDEERMEETKSETSMLEKEVSARPTEKVEEMKSALADKYDVTEEEVMNLAK